MKKVKAKETFSPTGTQQVTGIVGAIGYDIDNENREDMQIDEDESLMNALSLQQNIPEMKIQSLEVA